MKYADWRRQNPGAPAKLMEIGELTCEMLKTIRNNAGAKIRRGTRVTITGAHGGRFNVDTSGGTAITFVYPGLIRYIGPQKGARHEGEIHPAPAPDRVGVDDVVLPDGSVSRPTTSKAIGDHAVQIVCPFCDRLVRAMYCSLSGAGKKCECGALMRNNRAIKRSHPC